MTGQRGFTLVEMLIAAGLMALVAAIIGGILINSLSAEKTVRTTTQAASAGQLVATSIERGVRNATWIDLATTGGEYFLRVRTASGGETVVLELPGVVHLRRHRLRAHGHDRDHSPHDSKSHRLDPARKRPGRIRFHGTPREG